MRAALALALVVLAIATGIAARQPASDAFAAADAAIRAEMAKAGIPGAAVAVVVGDRVVWSRGFGVANVETSALVTPDTLFQIGSVTKSFTAAAVLTAASQGVLALDKPVSTYVSGLAPCVGAPTLTQLLSHTGGLIDEPDEFGPQGEEGLGAYQRSWTSEYCMLAPGRAFSYSNSGFALAGLALQEVDKKPFADVMRARILAPLGMARTTFRPTEAMTWPLAVGHKRNKAGSWEVVRPLPNDARLWPAGTLYSSANEMARFVVALMNDGKVEGKQSLPAGVPQQMSHESVHIPTTGQDYGLGLFLDGRWRPSHGGTMTGSVAHIDFEHASGPNEPVGVVVLTNGDQVDPIAIAHAARLAGMGFQGLRVGSSGDAGVPGKPPPIAEMHRGIAGSFRNPRRFTVEVVERGDAVVLRRFGRDFPMTYAGDNRFAVELPRGGTEYVAFGFGSDGRADYLQMNVWALARVPGPK